VKVEHGANASLSPRQERGFALSAQLHFQLNLVSWELPVGGRPQAPKDSRMRSNLRTKARPWAVHRWCKEGAFYTERTTTKTCFDSDPALAGGVCRHDPQLTAQSSHTVSKIQNPATRMLKNLSTEVRHVLYRSTKIIETEIHTEPFGITSHNCLTQETRCVRVDATVFAHSPSLKGSSALETPVQ